MPHDHDRAARAARLRLFRSQLVLRGKSIADVARAVGVTGGHLRLVVLGARTASARLIEALRSVLGDDVIAFVRRDHQQGEQP